MSDGPTSIDPSEPILRRTIRAPGYYNPDKNPPLERGAFTPNERDDDGLSFYLEREQSIDNLVRSANRAPGTVLVIRFTAGDIYAMGLTLKRVMRDGDLPGHVVVPEMNYADYQDKNRKGRIKEAASSLVTLGLRNIVFGA
jgi:hypothetical protein